MKPIPTITAHPANQDETPPYGLLQFPIEILSTVAQSMAWVMGQALGCSWPTSSEKARGKFTKLLNLHGGVCHPRLMLALIEWGERERLDLIYENAHIYDGEDHEVPFESAGYYENLYRLHRKLYLNQRARRRDLNLEGPTLREPEPP